MSKISVKSAGQIAVMREGGIKLTTVLKQVVASAKPGVTLAQLNQFAHNLIREAGGEPSFLNHQGYPAVLCTSVNNGIVHCIPDTYSLQEGDLLSVDCGLKWQGLHTDIAVSIVVGEDIHNHLPLLKSVYRALLAGTGRVRGGVTVGEVSAAIECSLKESNLTIMRQFVGHGVGVELHEPPIVPNVVGHDQNVVLPAGSVIAIEPIAGTGGEAYGTDADGWCARTLDGSPVAHFEHTVLITPEGPEVLTPLGEIIGFGLD